MNFKKFEVYGNPTLQQGGWVRTGEGDAYIKYTTGGDPNYFYRTCTLDYFPQHHPTQITITGIASKELELSVLTLRNDGYIIESLGWQDNGYTFNLGSTYDKLGVMFRFKNGDTITPNQVSFDIVGDWHDIPHYIHNTSTDTITTLPADIYANDTTATVGLKGNAVQNGTPSPDNPIQPQSCGERTGNLFNYNAYFDSVFTPYNEFFNYAELQLQPNTTYTLSTSYREYLVSSNRITAFIVATSNETPTTVSGGISNVSPITKTTESDGILKLYKRISGSSYSAMIPTEEQFEVDSWVMLSAGSTVLPYEPYGYKIPILSGGTTTPVYLGQVESTRRISKFILTGQEEWGQTSNYCFFLTKAQGVSENYYSAQEITIVCSHFQPVSNRTSTQYVGDGAICFYYYSGTSTARELYIRYNDLTTVTDFKTYLAQQYAAGTPVCVWYVLAESTTGIVNEPLRKIGNYADEVSGITIPTIAGKDSFDVLTTLKPSEVSLNYTGWHDASVKEWDGSEWQ